MKRCNMVSFEYARTNREQAMKPRLKGKFWCNHCDANLVGLGEKCAVCGKRSGKRTLKKESNAR